MDNHRSDLDKAGKRFDDWARDALFDPKHRSASELLSRAVDIHLTALYREFDMARHLATGKDNALDLATALGFERSAAVMLEGLLDRLARYGFLDAVGEFDADERTAAGKRLGLEGDFGGTRWQRYHVLAEAPDRDAELPVIETDMAAHGPDYPATLEFLAFGREHFAKSLRDQHDFMDRVLTGQEKAHENTWNRATNTDPLQDIHGIMGAKAIELLFDGGTILEVGAGTGNGLRNNLDTLAATDRLDNVERYIFTDVSMPFILNTRRAMNKRWPGVEIDWRLLNINKDFLEQRLPAASADLVYGVNAAHIAMRMVEFLQQCQRALRPGGRVVFAERLRDAANTMAPREIVLNQSRYHRTAARRHPDYRPMHAYLSRAHWLAAAQAAGFRRAAVWPGTDSLDGYFPEQYAAVFVAEID
ncbi:MAG: hypothetical protein CSB44_04050 [Gammaproteobacteria bacterium]|nr:MAG: hypothetical protein CSB44_04050 [Gammaproteobacteria bacterium]